ncbi:hypothetical protein FOA52_007210 [Chlamydomonas sp. UWO 241]|nr:hypothetical protein FOA52_007210 [Chlamydomonas sp. UWO 241]
MREAAVRGLSLAAVQAAARALVGAAAATSGRGVAGHALQAAAATSATGRVGRSAGQQQGGGVAAASFAAARTIGSASGGGSGGGGGSSSGSSSGGGGSSSSGAGWQRPPWRTAAAAAGAAGLGLLGSTAWVALADDAREPSSASPGSHSRHWWSSSSSGGGGSDGVSGGSGSAKPEAAIADELSASRRVLAALWQELQDDVYRARARGRADSSLTEVPLPVLSVAPGGYALQATLQLPPGADLDAIIVTASAALGKGSRSTLVSSSCGPDGSVSFSLDVGGPPGQPTSVAGRGCPGGLVARVTAPPPQGSGSGGGGGGGGEAGTATLTVTKRAGGFRREELSGLVDVARAAYLPPGSRARGRRIVDTVMAGPEASVDTMLGQMEHQMARGFVGGLGWMLDELARAAEDSGDALRGGGDSGADGRNGDGASPPAARTFSRVFTFGSGGDGGGDGDHAELPGGAVGGAAWRPGGAQQQQEQQAQAPGMVDGHDWGSAAAAKAVKTLQAMGAQVFPPGSKEKMDWGVLAGYEDQKRQIEDCLLYPLLRPEVFHKLAEATRTSFASNRPRAVLFEGPPGTGKTTSARVISSQAAVPLVYVPLEAVLSKWYGESEGLLSKVFKAAEALGGAIVFFDELDSLGGNRARGDVHEASRRMLSVLLREMDGFDARRTVVIGATNRKADLDAALLSRFDMVVTFGLPDEGCRESILARYARHLPKDQVARLAAATSGLSGRDLRDVAEHTERRWASAIIRGEAREGSLPGISEYMASAAARTAAAVARPTPLYPSLWGVPPRQQA